MLKFRARIEQQQIAVVKHGVVVDVVQDGRVRAAADDGGIGGRARPTATELILDEGFDLELVHAGAHPAHRFAVCFGGDVGGALH